MSDWRTLFEEEPVPHAVHAEPQILHLEPLRPEMAMVPVEYAEKTMHSLMRLHDELMDEKDKRVELVEKLSAKEQALAEMASYVKLLEAELERARAKPAHEPEVKRAPKPPPPKAPPPPKWEEPDGAVDAWVQWTMGEEPEPRAAPPPPTERPSGFKKDARKPEDWKVW